MSSNENDHCQLHIRNASDFVSTEWELVEITKYEIVIGNVTGSYYPYGIFEVVIRRDPHYYITALVIPSTFLCLLSFVAFLAPPDSGERVSLGVSMVLGLTVFQLLVSDTLPTASKQPPILNGYLSSTFFLASLVVPFSLFNVNIAHGDIKLTNILKYPVIRRMLLEVLPSLFFVPNYLDRINVRMTHQKKPQGDIIDEGIMTKAPVVKTSLSGKVEPEDNCYVGEKLTMSEKVKLASRTVGFGNGQDFPALLFNRFWCCTCCILAEFASLFGDD
ncbi:Neuronal acetylcholine receptor subunit alpha-5 [Apostichopus japonicus]|uniref:Neuronal acetylcholine receptor subunit alpha-5 n=1 Tax=Stichopus japonicus TaxID=307972 RepID=A0A2G8LFA9_STIJA|nr:Neuronal acetylcholine receptor subunit alpha-5 [Apostichopus japonicus]